MVNAEVLALMVLEIVKWDLIVQKDQIHIGNVFTMDCN